MERSSRSRVTFSTLRNLRFFLIWINNIPRCVAMTSVFDEKKAYLDSPYFEKHQYADYSIFYITITICTIFAIVLLVLNIVLGCCSRYSDYWRERHTGNRFLVSLWTATPHKQPALDYSELELQNIPQQIVYEPAPAPQQTQYLELQKRESDI